MTGAIPEPTEADWKRDREDEYFQLDVAAALNYQAGKDTHIPDMSKAALRREQHYRKENAALRRLLAEWHNFADSDYKLDESPGSLYDRTKAALGGKQ